ncbi:MAG TPA: sigma-70 family RNA polymerase sigma factor [Burkholderiales bacterium]|nr:sigma-70 family RNA polymerase sigma factor [Burkholderiales bacterium]
MTGDRMNRPPPDALALRLAELLAQCALRNQRAFADLYGLTSAKLYGVALRILRRQDWAEDVLQECYVNIWNHAGNYALQKSAPLTWMTSIVRNRCLDWLRRPQTEATGAEYDVAVEAWQDDSPGPMEQLMAVGDAQTLARCLRELEGKQRQSIMLAFFHGMTHTELASHMKQPLGTVKTWVRRGLERLKGCLSSA